MTDRPMTDAEPKCIRYLRSLTDGLHVRPDEGSWHAQLLRASKDLLARLDAQAKRIRELQVDAIDLNRLRRGLCEILCENIDSVDAVLCAVSEMREDLNKRIHDLQVDCEVHRANAYEAAEAAGCAPHDVAGVVRKLIAERDRALAALAFAASCIKSGEPWTQICEREIGAVLFSKSRQSSNHSK